MNRPRQPSRLRREHDIRGSIRIFSSLDSKFRLDDFIRAVEIGLGSDLVKPECPQVGYRRKQPDDD